MSGALGVITVNSVNRSLPSAEVKHDLPKDKGHTLAMVMFKTQDLVTDEKFCDKLIRGDDLWF
jgi:hypothetical protein